MKPRLILRADGDARIGLGHVMRLVAVAEIAGPQWHRVFVLRAPTDAVRDLVSGSVDEVVALEAFASGAAEAAWLADNLLKADDVLALDGYDFDFDYQSALREAVGALLFVDDLHAFPQVADVVLNPAGGISPAVYDLRRPGAQLLIGPRWAPLRAPFRKAALHPVPEPALVNTVLLCLGGADPGNATRHLAAELVSLPGVAHLHVAVGAAYQHWTALQEWAAGQAPERLTLHHALSATGFCEVMQGCGAAVTSASTVSYEYCSAGGGLLCVLPTAENQRGIYDFLLHGGLARPYHALGNALSAPDVGHIVGQLRLAQRQHFDGLAPDRLRGVLRSLHARARLNLRPATWADSDLLLAWANDAIVRLFSYSSTPIARADHEGWLRGKLADPSYLLLIAEVAGTPVGTIRYALDETAGTATLSYSLAAGARGQGLGAPLLILGNEAARHYWGTALRRTLGHVQRVNEASIKAFRRAGFLTVNDPATPTDSVSFEWRFDLASS